MQLFHWKLDKYINKDALPLFLYYVAPGEHPALQFHDHNTRKIVFVLSGEAEHIVLANSGTPEENGKNISYHIKVGDVLVIHPGCIHAYDHTETLELFNLVYDRNQLALPLLDGYSMPLFHAFFPHENTLPPEKSAAPVMHLDASEMALIAPLLNEMQLVMTAQGPGVSFEMLTLFMRIVALLGKMRLEETPVPRQSRYQIANALLLMARKYTTHISLDELAQSVNMSRRNFCRQFRQMTGNSPVQYLLRLRIDHAMELLQTTDLDVGTIAMQCGFCDSNYFCKQFRQICHKTPGAFRRDLQQAQRGEPGCKLFRERKE